MKIESVLQILKRKYVGKSFKFYYNTDLDGNWDAITQNKLQGKHKRDLSTLIYLSIVDVVFIVHGYYDEKRYYLKLIYNNKKYLIQLDLE